MAMFHFRLKSDKKPDGTKISAVQHVDYIRREGNFANIDRQENNKFSGNFISTAEIKNTLDGQNILLYKTDEFGSIRNSENGFEVTENASLTTISIALMLANETMNHKPLIISGSSDFKKSVIQSAIFANLSVSFADQLMQNEFIHQKEIIENDRKNLSPTAELLSQIDQIPSPLLNQLLLKQSSLLPKTDFACLHCPNSLWFIQNRKELTCFCRMMNLVSWNNSQKTSITICDGTFLTNEKN